MNIMSDRDRALDSGDAYTCEYCGAFLWVDVGPGFHDCPEGRAAAEKRQSDFNQAYEGDGKRVRTTITVVLETYDTEMALQHALSDFEVFFDEETTSRQDSIANFSWEASKTVEPLT